jgi:hypothetical protein
MSEGAAAEEVKADDSGGPAMPEEMVAMLVERFETILQEMTPKAIKEAIISLGGSTRGCIDRADLEAAAKRTITAHVTKSGLDSTFLNVFPPPRRTSGTIVVEKVDEGGAIIGEEDIAIGSIVVMRVADVMTEPTMTMRLVAAQGKNCTVVQVTGPGRGQETVVDAVDLKRAKGKLARKAARRLCDVRGCVEIKDSRLSTTCPRRVSRRGRENGAESGSPGSVVDFRTGLRPPGRRERALLPRV